MRSFTHAEIQARLHTTNIQRFLDKNIHVGSEGVRSQPQQQPQQQPQRAHELMSPQQITVPPDLTRYHFPAHVFPAGIQHSSEGKIAFTPTEQPRISPPVDMPMEIAVPPPTAKETADRAATAAEKRRKPTPAEQELDQELAEEEKQLLKNKAKGGEIGEASAKKANRGKGAEIVTPPPPPCVPPVPPSSYGHSHQAMARTRAKIKALATAPKVAEEVAKIEARSKGASKSGVSTKGVTEVVATVNRKKKEIGDAVERVRGLVDRPLHVDHKELVAAQRIQIRWSKHVKTRRGEIAPASGGGAAAWNGDQPTGVAQWT